MKGKSGKRDKGQRQGPLKQQSEVTKEGTWQREGERDRERKEEEKREGEREPMWAYAL